MIEPEAPAIDGPRALLKARLAQLAKEEVSQSVWERMRQVVFHPRRWVFVATGLAVLLSAVLLQFTITRAGAASTPDGGLTPGLALAVTAQDVCSPEAPKRTNAVARSVVYEVFEQYGIRDPEPRAYEIDYLITPSLGGADDIRNLWPQPYSTGTWNSRVKDVLEDHLHTLVCDGTVDLATAQREISADWIGAYKKYFQTDRPLPRHAAFRKDPPWE